MKLYYSPFSCSFASQIALREAGLDATFERVDLRTKTTDAGGDLRDVHAMGQVPILVTDDGHVLTENGVVLTWVGDRVPERALVPAPASFERYELSRWLSFVGTEIHKKGLALVYDPSSPEEVKTFARASIARPLGVLDRHLAERPFLLGESFTVADAYLFWALTIAPHAGIALDSFPSLRAYHARVLERPAVRAAMKWERQMHERPRTEARDRS